MFFSSFLASRRRWCVVSFGRDDIYWAQQISEAATGDIVTILLSITHLHILQRQMAGEVVKDAFNSFISCDL